MAHGKSLEKYHTTYTIISSGGRPTGIKNKDGKMICPTTFIPHSRQSENKGYIPQSRQFGLSKSRNKSETKGRMIQKQHVKAGQSYDAKTNTINRTAQRIIYTQKGAGRLND